MHESRQKKTGKVNGGGGLKDTLFNSFFFLLALDVSLLIIVEASECLPALERGVKLRSRIIFHKSFALINLSRTHHPKASDWPHSQVGQTKTGEKLNPI